MTKPELIDLVIDAGHGGIDNGAANLPEGILEDDLTLKISLYQEKRFKEIGGFNVSMTRTTDVKLTPAQRTKKVKDSKANLCLCNHVNAGGGDGAEIVVQIGDDEKLANLIKAEILASGQNFRKVYTKGSTKDPNIDYYYMNRDTKPVKTYIIEYGFLDSKGDDIKQLKEGWQVLAEAVVKAVCTYYKVKYTPPATAKAKIENIDQALKVLVSKGVINSPSYWLANANYNKMVDGKNARFLILQYWEAKTQKEVTETFNQIIEAMKEIGVVKNPKYWAEYAMAGRLVLGQNAYQLIINMANSL